MKKEVAEAFSVVVQCAKNAMLTWEQHIKLDQSLQLIREELLKQDKQEGVKSES